MKRPRFATAKPTRLPGALQAPTRSGSPLWLQSDLTLSSPSTSALVWQVFHCPGYWGLPHPHLPL